MAKFTSYKATQITEQELDVIVKQGAPLVSGDDMEKYKSMKTPKFVVNQNKVIDGVNIVDRAFSTRERHIVGATPTATLLYFCSYICIEVFRLAVVQIRSYIYFCYFMVFISTFRKKMVV